MERVLGGVCFGLCVFVFLRFFVLVFVKKDKGNWSRMEVGKVREE